MDPARPCYGLTNIRNQLNREANHRKCRRWKKA